MDNNRNKYIDHLTSIERGLSKEAIHIGEMISICNEQFGIEFKKAPEAEDMKHGTDLMPINPGTNHLQRIACRVRQYKYIKLYNNDFTIRYKTELPKILNGWSDYILYAWETPSGDGLYRWFIGNINVFRREYKKSKELQNRTPIPNKNGYTSLIPFKWTELSNEFIITKYPQNESYWQPINHRYNNEIERDEFINSHKSTD